MNFDKPVNILICSKRNSGKTTLIKHMASYSKYDETIIASNNRLSNDYMTTVISPKDLNYDNLFNNTKKKLLILDDAMNDVDELSGELKILLKYNKQFNITIIITCSYAHPKLPKSYFDYILTGLEVFKSNNKRFYEVYTDYTNFEDFNTDLKRFTAEPYSFMCINTRESDITKKTFSYSATYIKLVTSASDTVTYVSENTELKDRLTKVECMLEKVTNDLQKAEGNIKKIVTYVLQNKYGAKNVETRPQNLDCLSDFEN